MGIKALLQLMAASEAGIPSLEFYCFGDETFESSMRACLNRWVLRHARVIDLINLDSDSLFKKLSKFNEHSKSLNSELG